MTAQYAATQAIQALTGGERQNQRLLKMFFPKEDGPSGAVLIANRLDAHEKLSQDFHYSVSVLADDPDIALKDIMGKLVTLELLREDGSVRYFSGHVFDFSFIKHDAGFSYYQMELRPWLAFLRYRKNCCLFHDKTVEDQLAKIFSSYPMSDWETRQLREDTPMTESCQFDETDYNIVHRLIEAKGWYYWYEHSKDGHKLILSGDSLSAEPLDGTGRVVWRGESGVMDPGVSTFAATRNIVSNLYAASSFDFKSARSTVASVPTLNQQGELPQLETYEYSGAYGYKNQADGDNFVRLRMEEIEAQGKHFQATGNDDYIQCGRTFKLAGHEGYGTMGSEEGDNEFLIIEANHSISNNYEIQQGQLSQYHNNFICGRKRVPWRPGRGYNSVEPKIYGLQTATVVGPAGEEIHTDKYGRVRIQYHWDREGGYDQNSSTWVRVASTWAGSNFGFMAVPRIGQEVIVQFLDGNPNRPLITGRVYNESNLPPWDLPANKTQTGILSRSSQGGGYENANAIRFEDKKGAEEVWLHAEKDQRIEVENNESHWVGNDRSKNVDNNETVNVKNNRTETVGNDETITINNNRTEQVAQNETIGIGSDRTETVGKNESVTVGQNRTVGVGENESLSIAQNQSVSIGQNQSVDVGGDRSVTISGNKSETISGNKVETISQAKAETIAMAKALSVGLGYQVSVGGAMNTTVGLAQAEEIGLTKNVHVGSAYSMTAGGSGGSNAYMDGDEINLSVGKSKLVMKKDGTIIINGHSFSVGTSAEQTFKASGNITLKGKKIQEN